MLFKSKRLKLTGIIATIIVLCATLFVVCKRNQTEKNIYSCSNMLFNICHAKCTQQNMAVDVVNNSDDIFITNKVTCSTKDKKFQYNLLTDNNISIQPRTKTTVLLKCNTNDCAQHTQYICETSFIPGTGNTTSITQPVNCR